MCGIAGFLSPTPMGNPEAAQGQLQAMTDAIRHRGPDSDGLWLDRDAGIALGQRRLAILDLSDEGAQPMASACGRFMMVYNGELYNHLALRRSLEDAGAAPAWRGHSDTETLLAAIVHWGLGAALRRAKGMFAIALWDKQTRRLTLARDRMGEKPLYYGQVAGSWVFGSELKALHPCPGFQRKLNRDAVASYLHLGYVPEGQCIYAGLHKLAPGYTVSLGAGQDSITPEPFETFSDLVQQARRNTDRPASEPRDPAHHTKVIEDTLMQVVDEQMLSDVPLGCFLSGGVDSSLIASLMQAQRDAPIRSFAIGFDVPRFNEAPHAAEVARHLGTEHSAFILTDRDALNVVPDLPDIYDEPFADSSQIPTVLLCRAARQAVTVALSGDGGDEVFGGYNRHVLGPDLLRRARSIPRPLRRFGASLAQGLAPFTTHDDTMLRRAARRAGLPVTAIDKLTRMAPALAEAQDIAGLYRHFIATFDTPGDILVAQAGSPQPTADVPVGLKDAEWMMAMDSTGYLPGDILVKVDRAAMSASLETRAPFLDARVVAAAWALPDGLRIRGKTGKAVLRDILARHVPREMTERPKQGFAVPLDRWLRGELKEWAQDLLQDQDLIADAGLRAQKVQALWLDHQAMRANHGQKLWTVLMLLAWLRLS